MARTPAQLVRRAEIAALAVGACERRLARFLAWVERHPASAAGEPAWRASGDAKHEAALREAIERAKRDLADDRRAAGLE